MAPADSTVQLTLDDFRVRKDCYSSGHFCLCVAFFEETEMVFVFQSNTGVNAVMTTLNALLSFSS